MSRRSIATPCPVSDSLDHLLDIDLNDTTANIDFTTTFRASFRNVKPKRRQTQSVQFAICEDRDDGVTGDAPARATLLQPARRTLGVRPSLDIVENYATKNKPTSSIDQSLGIRYNDTSKMSQAPRRTTSRLSTLPEHVSEDHTFPTFSPLTQASRPIRRGTVYIPNEDTTMPSMYMGIFSPLKNLEVSAGKPTEQDLQVEVTGIAAQMAAKRGIRKSLVGNPPRRGVLQSTGKVIQEKTVVEDRFGQGGGKENVPPGFAKVVKTTCHSDTNGPDLSRRNESINKPISLVERSKLYAPTTASLLRREKHSQLRESQPKPAWNGGISLKQSHPIPVAYRTRPISPPPAKIMTTKPQVPTRLIIPVIQPDLVSHQHAILPDDIVNPALYEEDWLRHQEIAITQLVNKLLLTSRHSPGSGTPQLRNKLLNIYSTSEMSLMYTRLQAALFYGALSIPQETLDQGARLQNDIGLRKQFTDLWLCSYKHTALQAALEVVIGRECQSSQESSWSTTSQKPSKSKLRHFIEAFLIRNQDGKVDAGVKSRTAWSYQRTVLRSLILIKLLDLSKSERILETTDHLFQASSPFKTSVCALQALIQMLNPAVGDPVRALNHIRYHVSHVQHSLGEYNYHIENLAVDFRDGVRLARLVEILLYPAISKEMEKAYDSETTTILMPEGEALEFTDNQDWPLSQHLKITCQSRVTRLWNVQISLSTLKNDKGMDVLIDGITADDIVDGFREKTIRLLWALVNKWGLSGLIDQHDLAWEVRRLEARNDSHAHNQFYNEFESDFDENDNTFEACRALLRRWANVVTSSQNVRIRNFTTSFADGKAFEAIVNEYEPYLQRLNSGRAPPSTKRPRLQDRLTHLGCSTEFSQLFTTSTQTHIFSRDFVLAALAFLCSRLLAPSRRSRAATVIQRVWRGYWGKIADERRREKTKVAHACAEIVRSREVMEIQQSRNVKHEIELMASNLEHRFSRCDLGETANDSAGATKSPIFSPSSSSEADIWLSL